MRSIALAVVLGTLLVFAAQDFARGEDEAEAPDPMAAALAKVEARLVTLEKEAEYLRAREAALTTYVLANQQRAADLAALAGKVRQLGFEARKVPVDSRKALLKGLEGLAVSLRADLPEISREQSTMLKAIVKARKAAK